MAMIGTCGHEISDEFEADPRQVEIAIMDYCREGGNAVSYYAACAACRKQYEKWGIVLHNEVEEDAWMRGELEYPQ